MAKALRKIPATFAIQRGLAISDCRLWSKSSTGDLASALVYGHGIRGTQNVNIKGGQDKDVAQIQRVETARLGMDDHEMVAEFWIGSCDLDGAISMCVEPGKDGRELSKATREAVMEFIGKAKSSGAVDSVCRRYARNILNGSWLWRNRQVAAEISIRVDRIEKGGEILVCEVNAFDKRFARGDFSIPQPEEIEIAKELSKGFMGSEPSRLRVRATVNFGLPGSEIYPSQSYEEKEKGVGRILFKYPLTGKEPGADSKTGMVPVGVAMIRDQKIGNMIRTIDTYYRRFGEEKVAYAIEPMGASLITGSFIRDSKESAFELLKGIGSMDPASDDGQFMLAILIRGGVFGEKSEKKADKKEEGVDAESSESTESSESAEGQ